MHKHYSNIIPTLCLLAFLCAFITNVYLPLALWLLACCSCCCFWLCMYNIYHADSSLSLFFMQLQCILLGHATYIITTPIHMSFDPFYTPTTLLIPFHIIFTSKARLQHQCTVSISITRIDSTTTTTNIKPFVVKNLYEQFTNIEHTLVHNFSVYVLVYLFSSASESDYYSWEMLCWKMHFFLESA